MKRKWKTLNGYSRYSISNNGDVWDIPEKKYVVPNDNQGYFEYELISNKGNSYFATAHRLVATLFLPNPESKTIVHHIDHNPHNNNVDNLMWVTTDEHQILHGRIDRPICQFNKDGQFIQEFESCKAAGKQLGLNSGCILSCCKGLTKTSYGYVWKFKETN